MRSWFRRSRIAWVLVAALGLSGAGCAPAPTGIRRSVVKLDPGTVAGRITPQVLASTLDDLAGIARANRGTRRTGSAGDAATAAYLGDELKALGYRVEEDPFETPVFVDGTGDALEVLGPGGRTFEARRDFGPMMFSGAGSVEGRVVDLGWDPKASVADGPGCQRADFEGLPDRMIILVRPGPCFRRTVVTYALDVAGAVAVVSAQPQAQAGQVRRNTLVDSVDIPALAADRGVGDALAAAAASRAFVRINVSGTTEERTVRSVIAEVPGVDPARVVMIGAHLDSSMDGPGIDDDGSGVAAVLALARALAAETPPVTMRFAFWAAEESGLRGSSRYVEDQAPQSSERIVAYLNADMIGSPNGFPIVYDDASAAAGSDRIRDLFTADLAAAGLSWETMDLTNSADHTPFAEARIPTGGLFSGAGEIVSQEQAARFGRTAGTAADPCYHLACDGRENVDPALMLALARSLARVMVALAAD